MEEDENVVYEHDESLVVEGDRSMYDTEISLAY